MFEIGKRPKAGERTPEPKRFDRPPTRDSSTPPASADANSTLSGRTPGSNLKPSTAQPLKEPAVMKRGLDDHGGGRRDSSLISAAMEVEGTIRSNEDIMIEGAVKGSITALDSVITVGPKGRVEADIYADTVVINGNMTGDVEAGELIAVRQSALVVGNLKAPRISIEDGSRLRGTISMEEHGKDSPFAKRASAPSPRRAPVDPTAPMSTRTGSEAAAGGGDELPAQEPGTLASS